MIKLVLFFLYFILSAQTTTTQSKEPVVSKTIIKKTKKTNNSLVDNNIESLKENKTLAVEIIKKAEEIRSLENAAIKVRLRNEGDKQNQEYLLEILRSSGQKAYVDFLAPDVEVGRKILAVKRNYWTKFPRSRRVVPISKREMLGNSAFSIADLFQISADEDYDPTIIAIEEIDKKKVYKLDLKAKHKEAPYERIIYYVEMDGYFPVKADFMSVSGKLIKSMTAESRKNLGGMIRPEVLRMVDHVISGRVSIWQTLSMTPRNVPTNVFTQDYLKAQN